MRLEGGEWRVGKETLAEHIRGRRWFGGKGAEIRDVTIEASIPVRWPGVNTEYEVVRVRVTTDAGSASYQLFTTRAQGLDEALEDASFRRGLADAFVKGVSFEGAGTRWVIESEGDEPIVVPQSASVSLATGEQTNSSIIIEGMAILKLFRKLERGIHPDVEVTRFLTIEKRFVHVPVLLGTIRFEDKEGSTMSGMLQEYVRGATDAWTYTLARSRGFPGDGAAPADTPFQAEAERLGRVTREMHEALASGPSDSAFAFERATPGHVRQWTRSAAGMAERACDSLEHALQSGRLKDVGEVSVSRARAIVRARRRYGQWIEGLAADVASDAGGNTRTHGDYHLGQVLRSQSGDFLVIDFEGEPARPLSERRARQSPLRDVAGMLRSFAYASAMASSGSGPGAGAARAWEEANRAAFMRGYFSDAGMKELLPKSKSNADRLVSLFEAEKVFYELQYELDHRPDWLWVPMDAITRLLGA